ncbi:uncharacterized protein [Ambystoma mexicanum]|uniref:uncharacterized protein n=1 Tax=Ambystoma mexicanum TaxID=8296 RepID=UPI0037E71C61
MASVPSAPARAAVNRCPRRVLQAQGARGVLKNRPGRYDPDPTVFPGHPGWRVDIGRSTWVRGAGRLELGRPGHWDKAWEIWGAVPAAKDGATLRPTAQPWACSSLQLGNTCLLFHWSMQRRGWRQPCSHAPASVSRLPGETQNAGSLHLVLGPGAPALWKWQLVWRKGISPEVTRIHYTQCGVKQEREVRVEDPAVEDAALAKQTEETHLLCDGPLGDLSHEVPPSTMLSALPLNKPCLMGPKATYQEDPENGPLVAPPFIEAVLVDRDYAILDVPSTSELADHLMKDAQLKGPSDTGQKAPAAILQASHLEVHKLGQRQQQRLREQRWDR